MHILRAPRAVFQGIAAVRLPRRTRRPGRPEPVLTRILRGPRALALWLITALVTGSAGASFTESYRGLWLWARHHGLSGVWAAAFPAQVDVFIAVGELALFIALVDQWDRRSRIGAWGVTLLGLAVSVAGNTGHISSDALASRATAAVPPLAAASALAVGLGVLKRVVAHRAVKPDIPDNPVATVAADNTEAARVALVASIRAGNPISQRALASRFGLTRPAAIKLHREVSASANGHAQPVPEEAGRR